MVSSFHCGFTISHFLADEVVHYFGPTAVVTVTFMITGTFTYGVSYCSHYFVAGLFFIRFITGFLTVILIPNRIKTIKSKSSNRFFLSFV